MTCLLSHFLKLRALISLQPHTSMLPDDEKERMVAVNRQDYAMLLDLKVCGSHFFTRFAYRLIANSKADIAIFERTKISG